jgi:hypothetical protein
MRSVLPILSRKTRKDGAPTVWQRGRVRFVVAEEWRLSGGHVAFQPSLRDGISSWCEFPPVNWRAIFGRPLRDAASAARADVLSCADWAGIEKQVPPGSLRSRVGMTGSLQGLDGRGRPPPHGSCRSGSLRSRAGMTGSLQGLDGRGRPPPHGSCRSGSLRSRAGMTSGRTGVCRCAKSAARCIRAAGQPRAAVPTSVIVWGGGGARLPCIDRRGRGGGRSCGGTGGWCRGRRGAG